MCLLDQPLNVTCFVCSNYSIKIKIFRKIEPVE
ncbi:hypothetical protein Nmel_004522 [Mimus melanotis]